MSVVQEPRSEAQLLWAGLRVQLRVIGAVMLRELHTRFGRRNLGYLWLVGEPLILASGISLIHLVSHVELSGGFQPATFYASGYIAYITFRNNVNRASSTIEANKPLLYHRQVTLIDIVVARSILEAIATLGAMIVVLGFFVALGLADLPERPAYILLGMGFLAWLSTAVALVICGATEFSPLVERFVHPMTYLIMPFSGMFYVLDQLPPAFSGPASWIAIPQMTDLVRQGLRADFHSTFVNIPYLILVCSCLTMMGLFLVRLARKHMHFE